MPLLLPLGLALLHAAPAAASGDCSSPPLTEPTPSPRGRASGIRPPCGGANFQLGGGSSYASGERPVGALRVRSLNVFDPAVPGEDWWLFRAANAVHVPTREHVLRREVLLEEGRPWDPLRALESERNLRASDFIRRAEIRPVPAGERLDLEVTTQDSWSTQPQASLGTEGGDRYLIWGLEEFNLLGYGKSASFFHAQVGGKARDELRWRDPRLWGSRLRLTGLYAATSRGDEIGVLADRPFFSLESAYSVSALWARIIQEQTLFADGLERSKFIRNFRSAGASLGSRVAGSRDPVQRVVAGMHYSKDRFDPTSDTAAGTLPENRELSGPLLSYSLIQPRYAEETYVNKMERVEDFNLGAELSLSAGAMMRAFGSNSDRWIFGALGQRGIGFGEGRFALGQVGTQGRLRDGRLENALLFANLNLFWKSWVLFPQTWVTHLEWNATQALDRENQLILGGNTGLRGYKNNGFTGVRSVLLNLEDRVFWTRELFHLFFLGGAAFLDMGATSPMGRSIDRSRFKSDLGFGLRASSSRSSSGNVFRADLAYALQDGPGPDRWVVSIRGGQAFEIFNSTNRELIRSPASAISEESAGVRLRKR